MIASIIVFIQLKKQLNGDLESVQVAVAVHSHVKPILLQVLDVSSFF